MKRIYHKRPFFSVTNPGAWAFTLFVIFVACKILTPPSEELIRVVSPDGSKTARLIRYFYYENQPSYKIDNRASGKAVWLNLYHLPAYTNVALASAQASIKWSDDSQRLDFLMNGTSIWHHVFGEM